MNERAIAEAANKIGMKETLDILGNGVFTTEVEAEGLDETLKMVLTGSPAGWELTVYIGDMRFPFGIMKEKGRVKQVYRYIARQAKVR